MLCKKGEQGGGQGRGKSKERKQGGGGEREGTQEKKKRHKRPVSLHNKDKEKKIVTWHSLFLQLML